MNKFGRNFELIVQATGGGPDVIIKPPLTVEFDVTRHRFSSATMSVIRIYNLSKDNRAKLRKNRIGTDKNTLITQRKVLFKAGYGDKLPTLLNGQVMKGFSVRAGEEYITTLEIFDGGVAFATATIEKQYGENVPYKTAITDLSKSLSDYGVGLGSIGNFPGTAPRGLSISGSTMENLRELTNGGVFIDDGKVHCLQSNETVPSPVKVIDASAGLLNTPEREETFVTLEMLFEPSIIAGQKLEVKSSTEESVNGIYQVIQIKHRGIISQAVNGDCTTSLTLGFGKGTLSDVQKAL